MVEEVETSTAPSKTEGYIATAITCSGVTEATWDNTNWKVSYIASNLISKEVSCTVTFKQYLSNYLINLSNSDTSIVEQTHEETVQTPVLTDYRYTGKDPNNYVYFGCSEDCTNDNLYRIIGVMPTQSEVGGTYENRVKLIKNDYYIETKSGYLMTSTGVYPPGGGSGKGYLWTTRTDTRWELSVLNTKVLNEVYWNSLGDYQKYIGKSVWFTAGIKTASQPYSASSLYSMERWNTAGYLKGSINVSTNVGLMYPSDYGYSIGIEYSNQSPSENGEIYKNNAWLYNLEGKYYEWLLNPTSDITSGHSTSLYSDGRVLNANSDHGNSVFGIRPTFYLKSDVLYERGDGSLENPYRLTIND